MGNFSSATIRLEFVCMLVYVMPGVHCAAVGCNNSLGGWVGVVEAQRRSKVQVYMSSGHHKTYLNTVISKYF